MGQLVKFEDMSLEAIEVACQSAFEECESVFRAIESKGKQLEYFGRLLTAAKTKVAHGEWENWLTDTFQGQLPLRTAQRWMATAKAPQMALLNSDESSEIVPRSERKTGRVEVQEPGQQSVQADEPAAKPEREKDDDPNPAPKTNTKHSAATAKAKEADRNPPAPITPEIIEEPKLDAVQQWIQSHSLSDLIGAVIDQLDGDKAKRKAAKELRKMADTLDPPTVGAPNLEAVQEWAEGRGLKDFDSEKFFAHYALADWKYGKAKTPIKDWKLAAINAYGRGSGWAVDGSNSLPF